MLITGLWQNTPTNDGVTAGVIADAKMGLMLSFFGDWGRSVGWVRERGRFRTVLPEMTGWAGDFAQGGTRGKRERLPKTAAVLPSVRGHHTFILCIRGQ